MTNRFDLRKPPLVKVLSQKSNKKTAQIQVIDGNERFEDRKKRLMMFSRVEPYWGARMSKLEI